MDGSGMPKRNPIITRVHFAHEFYAWLHTSAPGDIAEYWSGDLNRYRFDAPKGKKIPRLAADVAMEVNADSKGQSVFLFQKKNADNDYTYFARKMGKR